MSILYIILGIIFVVIVWAIAIYNKFVNLTTNSDEAWSDIAVQMKRRYDLIPNLVNAVKGYAVHEQTAFEKVSEARARAINAGSISEHAVAENALAGALKSVFAIAEAYPELKANQNFLELQRELSDTENKIQAARRFYNTNVRDLNVGIDSFPSSIVASVFKFIKRDFFELREEESQAENPVPVNF